MKKNKGFAPIAIVIMIVVLLAIGGVIYYSSNQKISNSQSKLSATVSKAVIPVSAPASTPTTYPAGCTSTLGISTTTGLSCATTSTPITTSATSTVVSPTTTSTTNTTTTTTNPTTTTATTTPTIPPTTTATTTTSLKTGSSGSDVKVLQRSLQSLGFLSATATIDGVYGPATENAVKAYQTSIGLTADGIVGTKTIQELNKQPVVGPLPSPASTYTYLTSWGYVYTDASQIALDPSVNATMPKVYVADGSDNVVRRFKTTNNGASYDPDGVLGLMGQGDGQFFQPHGIAINPSTGDFYVVDTGNNRIQKFNSTGTFLVWFGKDSAGNTGLHTLGSGLTGVAGTTDGAFNHPNSITVTSSNVYVTDTLNNRVQKFDLNGNYISQFSVSGPSSIAVDTLGNIYVGSYTQHCIRKFTATGTLINTLGTCGVASTATGQFNNPNGIAIDSSNNVYVVERGNNRIQKFNSSGTFINKLDTWTGSTGSFYNPYGIAVDTAGKLYVLDSGHNLIQKFQFGNNSTPTPVPVPLDQQKTPATSPTSVFTKTLETGSTGGNIKILQQALQLLGFLPTTATIDGVYGSTTEAAVKTYQTSVGLVSDGVAGSLTLKKIFGL